MPTTASEAKAVTATQSRPNAATATQPRPPRVSDENAHPNLGSSQDNTPGGYSYNDSSDDESKDSTNEHVNEGLEDPRDTRPVNVKAEMELLVDKFATEDLSMSPSDVYIATAREIVRKYGRSYHGHTRDYVISRAHRARAKLNHGDAFRSVENNMAKMKDGTDNFFVQCHHVFPSTKYGVLQRIMIFANPALLALLCALSVDIFIDATFSCTPLPFYQTLIIMVHDPITNMYVPIMYALMTTKSYESYW